MKSLQIATDLSLPLDISGQTIAMFGIRGSGKTNTAGALAEELLTHGHPIAVIDPTDAWWGLRAGRDGNPADGFPVVIFGGPHGDIPLQETDGKVIAEFLVQDQIPVVLSLRHLRKNAQRRFVTEFCEELYHLKGADSHRTPLTVFIDEAPLFVPQKVMGETARTVGAVEDLIARGRNSGFGVVLISQRSATLNADVRTQADTVICHRVTSPLDRKAISDWFEENASVDKLKEILQSLAVLPNGEAWVWAPTLNIMKRVQMRLRRTLDSSATPKAGQVIRTPKTLATIDLDKLKSRLTATIEKAKADDPKELRKEILSLKKEIVALKQVQPAAESKIVEVSIMTDEDRAHFRLFTEAMQPFQDYLSDFGKQLVELRQMSERVLNLPTAKPYAEILKNGLRTLDTAVIELPFGKPRQNYSKSITRPTPAKSGPSADLGKCERAILQVLANFPHGCQSGKLTLLTGYRYSGGFKSSLSTLRQAGYIEGGNTEVMRITDAGLSQGPFSDMPSGQALIDYWLTHQSFGVCERKILSELVEHPDGLSADQICQRTGYQYSGGFKNALSNLRTAGVLVGRNTETMRASEILFE